MDFHDGVTEDPDATVGGRGGPLAGGPKAVAGSREDRLVEAQVPPPGTQTLARGLDILRAVADGATDLKSVVAATGIGRSTAHRLLQMLKQRGFLYSGQSSGYSLGSTLIELGFKALYQSPVPVLARPVLEQLTAKYLDTVHLAVEDEGQVLYVDKIPGSRGAEMRSRVGHRMPLSRTGIGKALLLDKSERWAEIFDRDHAGMSVADETRKVFLQRMRGYAERGTALDLEENEPGIRCVSAPIRDGSGAIVAAISLTATNPYMPPDRMAALRDVMAQTALTLSKKLGYAGSRAGSGDKTAPLAAVP
ncbi:IclR family transcriptional regulator [Paenarthrobacter sp. Z7-10]|uniref:IclR family transcriptional regulator n=1 Tax=Paenarthrobacter sp. Z7-10 TaxID=2787635 RepID=UPI0022A9C9A3|nr:IclR family transcriptional regulator [Paenarthrobacter sp. Z7-10]MCZ2404694.1 IclR family transcriptional regulator [Paenarthrobacter sp. Z7-10]